MNERMKVLKLLEEGKINAEEAAKLLEALNYSTSKEKKGSFWSYFGMGPEFLGTVFKSFKHFNTEEEVKIPKKKRIEFKGVSGDLEVVGSETETIQIEKEGMAIITEDDDTLKIKAVSGDIKIITPKDINFEFKGISGDLEITEIKGDIDLSSVSGEIKGSGLSGSFKGEVVSGDIDLDFDEVKGISIKSKSGDVTLRLNEGVNARIEIETEEGETRCEFQLKEEIRKENYLKGIIGEPKAEIKIHNEYGDVIIKKKDSCA